MPRSPSSASPLIKSTFNEADRLALIEIVSRVPLTVRQLMTTQIQQLQTSLQLPHEDLTIDRRLLRGAVDDPGHRAFTSAMERRRRDLKIIQLEWRDETADEHRAYSVLEAAEILKRTILTVRNYLSKYQGVWHTKVDDQLVTVRRLARPKVAPEPANPSPPPVHKSTRAIRVS